MPFPVTSLSLAASTQHRDTNNPRTTIYQAVFLVCARL